MNVIIKLQGGLGNQMFQYAFGKRISKQTGRNLILDLSFLKRRDLGDNFVYRNFDLDIFNLSEYNLVDDFSEDYELIVDDLNMNSTNIIDVETIIDKCIHAKSKNIYLDGYWSSPKYFVDFFDVDSEFSFKTGILPESNEINNQIIESNSVLLNVRRQDFLLNEFHGVYGKDYILSSIEKLKSYETDLKFFIFSDDVDWCERNLHDIPNSKIVDHIHKGFKFSNYLQLMINCRHFIIPNSTFAWWAAYLSKSKNKKIIKPEIWLKQLNSGCDFLFHGVDCITN